jgi:hypothetical protein
LNIRNWIYKITEKVYVRIYNNYYEADIGLKLYLQITSKYKILFYIKINGDRKYVTFSYVSHTIHQNITIFVCYNNNNTFRQKLLSIKYTHFLILNEIRNSMILSLWLFFIFIFFAFIRFRQEILFNPNKK